jgi:hypothetical protein
MEVRDAPSAGGAPEHNRATRKPLLVAQVKCRDRCIGTDLVDAELFRNQPLEGWPSRGGRAKSVEHPLELRLDRRASFEPLRRLRRRKERRRVRNLSSAVSTAESAAPRAVCRCAAFRPIATPATLMMSTAHARFMVWIYHGLSLPSARMYSTLTALVGLQQGGTM